MISALFEERLGNSLNSKPDVSVVIVTYNSQDEIGLCLDSLEPYLSNSLCETVIIDNASQDGTASVINSWGAAEITFINNSENVGFTKAVNQGIAKSSGEYIFILNPDTQLTKNSIDGLVRRFNSNSEIAAVAPQLRFPDGRIQYSCRRFPTRGNVIVEMLGLSGRSKKNGWKMADFDHTFERDIDQPAGAALMVRRSILIELGGLDERFPMFFSDVDLCKRIRDAGGRIIFCPEGIITHIGGSSIFKRRSAMIATSHLSLIRYFFKHNRRGVDLMPNVVMAILLILGIPLRLFAKFFSTQTEPEGKIL
ncbi:MAG: glycosyl transferase [Candidatus Marinimicrobia bacterium]|nr:glycosyl transferase [Candidatus Neomarinimicrobiota bacterium]